MLSIIYLCAHKPKPSCWQIFMSPWPLPPTEVWQFFKTNHLIARHLHTHVPIFSFLWSGSGFHTFDHMQIVYTVVYEKLSLLYFLGYWRGAKGTLDVNQSPDWGVRLCLSLCAWGWSDASRPWAQTQGMQIPLYSWSRAFPELRSVASSWSSVEGWWQDMADSSWICTPMGVCNFGTVL